MPTEGQPERALTPEDAAFVRGFTAGAMLLGAGPELASCLTGAAAGASAAALARLAEGGDAARAAFVATVRVDVAMPDGAVERWLGYGDADLRLALCTRGAAVLGRSLAGGPPEARARAMASVGQPFASLIDEASRAAGAPDAARAAAQLTVGRAALVKIGAAGDPRDRLLALGFFDLLPGPEARSMDTSGACILALAALSRRLPVEVREVFARVCPPPVW